MKLICFLKTAYRSIAYFLKAGFDYVAPISGHDYQETESHDNVSISILKCEICGEIDVSWSKP